MEAYLDCETCMKLWAEYGAATKAVVDARSVNPEHRSVQEEREYAALEKIREHVAEAHSKPPRSVSARKLRRDRFVL